MEEQSGDYAVGYGKPPVETRFQKGQSGNPEGRPRSKKQLVTLLAEALSGRTGYPKPDGSWMTYAEAIFASLVAEAAGADLKAKKLLFDVLVKLQQANICWDSARLPEIQLDGGESEARASVSDEIDRLAAAMTDEPPAQDQSPSEPQSQNRPGGEADPAGSPRTP